MALLLAPQRSLQEAHGAGLDPSEPTDSEALRSLEIGGQEVGEIGSVVSWRLERAASHRATLALDVGPVGGCETTVG